MIKWLRYIKLAFIACIVGSFAPAGPNTIWKKEGDGDTEAKCYPALMGDAVQAFVPKFYRVVDYNEDSILFFEALVFWGRVFYSNIVIVILANHTCYMGWK